MASKERTQHNPLRSAGRNLTQLWRTNQTKMKHNRKNKDTYSQHWNWFKNSPECSHTLWLFRVHHGDGSGNEAVFEAEDFDVDFTRPLPAPGPASLLERGVVGTNNPLHTPVGSLQSVPVVSADPDQTVMDEVRMDYSRAPDGQQLLRERKR